MKTFEEVVAQMDEGQRLAILRKVARAQTGDEAVTEEVFRGVLTGALQIVLVEGAIKLVDHTGRCIPTKEVTSQVVDANRAFQLEQPAIDYAMVLGRQQEFFPGQQFVAATEFEERAQALLAKVEGDKQIANLRKGVYLPFCLPKLDIGDYGRTLEETFLVAVERSYEAQFPERKFYNHRTGTLAGQVRIDQASRHGELIEAMANDPVVGVLYPTALQGFSIEADRQMIAQFPPGFVLAGAIDLAAAITAYPEVLAKNGKTPALDCAANSWRGRSILFHTSNGELGFDYGGSGFSGFGDCSGGVVVFG